MMTGRKWQVFFGQNHYFVLVKINMLLFFVIQQLNGRIYQKRAKNIKHPMKLTYNIRPSADKDSPK